MTTAAANRPETVREQHIAASPRFKVLLHNDDVNGMEHVVNVLMRVFRFQRTKCERIMLEAHYNGLALCAVEPFEQAEFHRDRMISFSLVATIEPE